MTVDRELLRAAEKAVAAGSADSISGWVNLALAERAAAEQRLQALAAAVAEHEREFGEITQGELRRQERADRRNALVVRGPNPRATRKRRRGGAA